MIENVKEKDFVSLIGILSTNKGVRNYSAITSLAQKIICEKTLNGAFSGGKIQFLEVLSMEGSS